MTQKLKARPRHQWSAADDEVVCEHYTRLGADGVVERLGGRHTVHEVRWRASVLGVPPAPGANSGRGGPGRKKGVEPGPWSLKVPRVSSVFDLGRVWGDQAR